MNKLEIPEVIFGTSGLGNLYVALPEALKVKIVLECVKYGPRPVIFDSAGKYGAGLALESLGNGLRQAGVDPKDVIISNKLGWMRTELKTAEPTFEPGVWRDLKYDAVQQISAEGIIACYEQGNELLNGYKAQWVSVHDPDEYLASAKGEADYHKRFQDILAAYEALTELKQQGRVAAVGIGAKNWKVTQEIIQYVDLDWVMIANSMTVHSHPGELLDFMEQLRNKDVKIINSAVFNGGFLTGQDYYNYQPVSIESNPELYHWREEFYGVCSGFNIKPEVACAIFARCAPGVKGIALSTTNPNRVKSNADITKNIIPDTFWRLLVSKQLINARYAETYLYQ
ncbi:MAG TPA: aldo/keto reductase [Arachidicoccus sp.]|nr:aldo/keto reductase [Arachidicoccus sp.]